MFWYTDLNECDLGTHDCDDRGATCVNTMGWYECKCSAGYHMDLLTGVCAGNTLPIYIF